HRADDGPHPDRCPVCVPPDLRGLVALPGRGSGYRDLSGRRLARALAFRPCSRQGPGVERAIFHDLRVLEPSVSADNVGDSGPLMGSQVSTRLPISLTRFVGREAELAEAAALLADNRLLTLTGPGGGGKTRLAMQLADRLADGNPDGVWFVDFSPLSGGEFVWDRVAVTVGVREPGPGRTWAEAVGRYLASRQALVLLDN